jgi:ribosomal protein L35
MISISTLARTGIKFLNQIIQTAGHKTSSTASKRFIRMGSGALKYAHAGKKHLNRDKRQARLKRLSATGILKGVWLKKMNKIL